MAMRQFRRRLVEALQATPLALHSQFHEVAPDNVGGSLCEETAHFCRHQFLPAPSPHEVRQTLLPLRWREGWRLSPTIRFAPSHSLPHLLVAGGFQPRAD